MKLSDSLSLFSDRHLSVYQLRYINREGRRAGWTLASRESAGPKCMTGRLNSADAVVIVPYHRERRQLVIIREFRVALGGFQYGFPAGLVDPGESVGQAVERELAEETGLRVLTHLRQSPVVFTSSGITDESVVMAYVECGGDPSDAGNSASEVIETHFVGPGEAGRLCRDDSILMDVKTWLVLTGFAASGSI
ncbi:DNA mismatch repair protein MutT [Desulfosarcina alkanivorans]|jgi:ADP-ribose pyrophosphatase|uniref:GDP-mannose pyrophosphatase n=1 Tax=Desulfosarcina alkanivorans TaxID=571177 RepID=A0A5K7YNT9_9BACT|nr:NUDIX hydrolase [Desulfosarcina alkanivorans]BBO66267.1 DNA mismatch repair protein MutT [Desulfosarcina alkanivorans]